MSQPPYLVYIALEFDEEGRKEFADFTRRNVDEYLAIILDGQMLSAPVIKSAILDGRALIEGGFKTVEEADELANSLNLGSLPITLKVVSMNRIR
jgi:preprotein translocase subunit SecD